MKMKTAALLASLSLGVSTYTGFAGKATELQPKFTKPGKVVVEDGFDAASLGKTWVVNKGDWQVKDGAVVGRMKKSDNHAAVMLLSAPNRNSIIRFSFKFDDSKGFNLSYNSAKGHLFRILVTPEGLTVNKDKDKKDAKSKNEVMATAKGRIAAAEWHTMQVEVQGTKASVQTDFGLQAEVSNSALDVDKTGYRFVTGSSVTIDDVKVWKVE